MWSSLNLIEVFEGDESVLQEQKNFFYFFHSEIPKWNQIFFELPSEIPYIDFVFWYITLLMNKNANY